MTAQGKPQNRDKGRRVPDRSALWDYTLMDEAVLVRSLVRKARVAPGTRGDIEALARRLVHAVRAGRRQAGGVDAFMNEYALSSEEGVVLMCLAEALLRIPDARTADRLIADKIGGQKWQRHLGKSDSLFVNASTWGLMLTGRVVELGADRIEDFSGYLKSLVSRSGEPIIRQAMRHAMRIMGKQFVLGRTITEALGAAAPEMDAGYRFSFDMLGEAAMTAGDAARYLAAYETAVEEVARHAGPMGPRDSIFARPSISVKLSALHPRYEPAKAERLRAELLPRVLRLCEQAKAAGLGLTIDAEEVERLDLSLGLFGELAVAPALSGWDGLGLAVQAYGKRALPALEWLAGLAQATGRRIPLRLVKGAYWDTEIKRAQENGLAGYPVFTRKTSTDVSYLACVKYLLKARRRFYAQFATHNAHTLAAVSVLAGTSRDFEFQRLHGMGQALYEEVIGADKLAIACRVYAPVGSHEDLLAYLVRRLLENGANTSFVNRLADDEAPIREIIADPVEETAALKQIAHPQIVLPREIFAPRVNSKGLALWDEAVRLALLAEIADARSRPHHAGPIISGERLSGPVSPVTAPHDRRITLGEVVAANDKMLDTALKAAGGAQGGWDRISGDARADILERAADLYEARLSELMGIIIHESGKTLQNALDDVREAVDFLRYYAAQARAGFSAALALAGPTGERNEMRLHGRGVFACIAPWNFPVAIFTGQVAAALAAGNAVIAKPAEQTPLVAAVAVRLMHEAGVPGEVLHLITGEGGAVGAKLVADPRISGVAFTGSNETATIINRSLARRAGAIVPLIAETGGQNAMIVDSSALPEQAVADAMRSAFDSAGQRCSAARILFVQNDVAGKIITMLQGAMEELRIGDPLDYATDVGPVIDEDARDRLNAHKARMASLGSTVMDLALPPETGHGTFVSPAAYRLDDLKPLTHEVFGPVLHVITYSAGHLGKVCDAINDTGFGLTLGVHTRIERTAREIRERVRVGNVYINRNQVGAVVGAQPFGGERLSGTGPKAGGPHYLQRFATERVTSTDTTASGGNAALMSLGAAARED